MSELGPIARLLVDSAREGLGPDDIAVARVRARVTASVAAGAATTAVATKAAAASGAGIASAKIVALVALAGVATGGTIVVANREPDKPRMAHAAPPPVSVTIPIPPPAVAAPPPTVAAAPALVVEQPRHERPKVVRAIAPAPPEPPAAVAPPSLARELALIDDATSALRGGQPADAIATLAIYDHETAGHGQLAEDGAAVELEALCALHAPSVPAKLSDFDRRWPHSAQRERIGAACANAAPPRP
jgi:hypothetical protein